MGAIIKHISYCFPKKAITNKDLSKKFKSYNFERFEKKVGIKKRYVCTKNETALDLALNSVEKLFKENNINKDQVGFLIYVTQSPEYFLPTTACIIQDKCGLPKNMGAIDINLGCSGYSYAVGMATKLLSESIKNILIVTSETYSKYINDLDKTNKLIFGDASTASIITNDENYGDYEFLYGSDGAGANSLIVKNGCTFPIESSPDVKTYGSDNRYTDNNIYMNGPEVFNFTLKTIPQFFNKIINANKINIEDIDHIILHQANKFMLNTLRKKMKLNSDKFFIDLEDGGNTVSNTIPIAIKKYCEKNINNSKKIHKILILGFGVGLSWSGGVINLKI